MSTPRWIWHGGGLQTAQAHFGGEDWLDLSTGINPSPWPCIDRCHIDWQRLPEEQDLAQLEAIAAAHFGCDPSFVCAVPGTEIAMRLIGSYLPAPFYHTSQSYRTHGDIGPVSKALDVDTLLTSSIDIGDGTLILANPNNPDGRLLSADSLRTLHKKIGTKSYLIVDEAFGECSPQYSLASNISDDEKLLIFRSFGKFFGLAGLRLGFVLGPRSILSALRQTLGAWPLSAAAIAIGKAAYQDRVWIENTRTKLELQAQAMDQILVNHGLRVKGHCPLFRLIEHPHAMTIFKCLARHHILTRPFDYAPSWLRIGLASSSQDLLRLDKALRDG